MPGLSDIFDSWRKPVELLLGILADTAEIVRVALVLPPRPVEGVERMRALQVSAIIIVVLLALWLRTTILNHKVDTLTLVLVTLLYFTVLSWVIAAIRSFSGLDPEADMVGTSLSLVIGFSVVAIFIAAVFRQIHFLFPLDVDAQALPGLTAGISVVVAGAITVARSLYLRKTSQKPYNLALILINTAILMAGTGLFLYFIA